jgi:hypothetical protein
MLLIPEIQTVVILVPRTGSGSLRRAIAERYPQSMLIYRHMEADGIPAGYDRWRRIGVVRDPLLRLWSLYKFLRTFDGPHDPAYIASMRRSVARPFSEWIVHNETPFTTPYDSAGRGRFFPNYTVRHPLPENRKSQFMYLRPDLGTEVWRYTELPRLAAELDIKLGRHNGTDEEARDAITPEALDHMDRYFAWDFEATFRGHLNRISRRESVAA